MNTDCRIESLIMKRSSNQKRVLVVAAVLLFTFSFGLFITPGKAMTNINPNQAVTSINVLDMTQDPNGAFEIRLRLDGRINITYAVETFALADTKYSVGNTSITIKDNNNPNVLVKSVVASNDVIYTNTTTTIGIQNVTWNSDNSKATLTLKTPLSFSIMAGDVIKITNYTKIGSLSRFDEYVIHGFIPEIDSNFVQNMVNNVTIGGKGLFFWGGYYPALTDEFPVVQSLLLNIIPVILTDHFTIEENLYLDQSWVGQIELKVNGDYGYNSSTNDFTLLQRTVVWESSPLVKERIFTEDAKKDAKVLVYQPEQGRSALQYNFTGGEPLVAFTGDNVKCKGPVVWVSMCSGQTTAIFSKYTTQGAGPNWNRVPIPGEFEFHQVEANKPFYLWPYFNFFQYQTAMFLANKTASQIDDYASWPLSPIPHSSQAVMWMMFVAALWVFNFVLFFTLGKKKKTTGATGTPAEVTPTTPESKEFRPSSEEMTAEERKAAEKQPEEKLMEEPGESEASGARAGPRGPQGPHGPGGVGRAEPPKQEPASNEDLLLKLDEEKPEDEDS